MTRQEQICAVRMGRALRLYEQAKRDYMVIDEAYRAKHNALGNPEWMADLDEQSDRNLRRAIANAAFFGNDVLIYAAAMGVYQRIGEARGQR